jgi:predicted aspartyl protease
MTRQALNRRQLAALIGAGAFWPLRTAADVPQPAGPLIDEPPAGPYLPPTDLAMLADLYARMTAPVRVNGAGPFPFLVDTGANQSVISLDLAVRLGLPMGPAQALNGVAGVQMAPTATADLGIGERLETGVSLSVLPREGVGGAGILGLDRLADRRLILDFRRRRMRIEPRAGRWGFDGEVVVRARRRSGSLTLIDARVAGAPVIAFLDSGAEHTLGNLALRERTAGRGVRLGALSMMSATGQTIAADMISMPKLELAGMSLESWPVAFADLHTFRLWKLEKTPAILVGIDLLSRFEQVGLDFARSEVRFRVPGVRVRNDGRAASWTYD